MYDEILKANGYTKHSVEVRSVQCWVKEGCSDINVDSSTGSWFADEAWEVGTSQAQMKEYFAETSRLSLKW